MKNLPRLVARLRALSRAVTEGPDAVRREYTMRVPAEPDRDADLVLSTAASLIEGLIPEGQESANLGQKYIVLRAHDAGPVDHSTFVLRIDGKDRAALRALEAYAIATRNWELKVDLLRLLHTLEQEG